MTKLHILVLIGALVAVTYGLSFQPMPPESNSTLIWYQASNANSTHYWIDQLDQFLKPYHTPRTWEGPIDDCRPGEPPEPGSTTVCDVKVDTWYPCVASAGYNYNSSHGGPCIFLKLNEIFGWIPEYYNSSTIPDLMPNNLKDFIRRNEYDFGPNGNANKAVWLSCLAENPADIENIGPISYLPHLGFDGRYFPFLNVDEYLSPLIAIHFERPARGVLINIECKAWARNIIHDGPEGRGSVHFELLVDN